MSPGDDGSFIASSLFHFLVRCLHLLGYFLALKADAAQTNASL